MTPTPSTILYVFYHLSEQSIPSVITTPPKKCFELSWLYSSVLLTTVPPKSHHCHPPLPHGPCSDILPLSGVPTHSVQWEVSLEQTVLYSSLLTTVHPNCHHCHHPGHATVIIVIIVIIQGMHCHHCHHCHHPGHATVIIVIIGIIQGMQLSSLSSLSSSRACNWRQTRYRSIISAKYTVFLARFMKLCFRSSLAVGLCKWRHNDSKRKAHCVLNQSQPMCWLSACSSQGFALCKRHKLTHHCRHYRHHRCLLVTSNDGIDLSSLSNTTSSLLAAQTRASAILWKWVSTRNKQLHQQYHQIRHSVICIQFVQTLQINAEETFQVQGHPYIFCLLAQAEFHKIFEALAIRCTSQLRWIVLLESGGALS